ncbi:hypothetical protein Sfulv_41870 [Streptomyces fulvorobeus]|uniref:Uncharacterized protein n=1 Tax=Streptomyces fulvorobeus TaxID=284028 RepID=A0A7J0CCD9_9ACTN|nr:hypothetical protein Sfulv_41870 [Streptomyces fulvorobeus]
MPGNRGLVFGCGEWTREEAGHGLRRHPAAPAPAATRPSARPSRQPAAAGLSGPGMEGRSSPGDESRSVVTYVQLVYV